LTHDEAARVGEAGPVPVHAFDVGDFTSLALGKLGAIDIFTGDLIRSADPNAVNTIELTAGIQTFTSLAPSLSA
jgi:hypothetical protein